MAGATSGAATRSNVKVVGMIQGEKWGGKESFARGKLFIGGATVTEGAGGFIVVVNHGTK